MSALVEASGLAIYGRLEPLSLNLQAGALVGLVGPNGSGKTSLLHALALIPPARGEVRIAGANPRGLHPDDRQRLFSFLPANREVIWPLKARDLIDLGLPPGSDWSGIAKRLDLGGLLERRMDRLSTGERSRVMIARALAPDPRLLLLDEPIANLDPYWQLRVLAELRRLAADEGKAVLLAIHDLRAALDHCDRLLVMNDCRMAADAAPDEFKRSGLIEQVFQVRLDGEAKLRPLEGRRSSP